MSRDLESGSSQYLSNTGLPPGLNGSDPQPLTMSVWVMWESITTQIMGVYANDADNHFHRLQAGGTGGNKLQASSAAGGTTVNATSTGSMSTGTWYHCGATFGPTAGTDRRVYLTALGGTQEAVSNTTNRTPTVHQIALGAHFGVTPSGYLDGLLAHAAMWLAQLNDLEMAALSRGVSPFMIRPSSLISYWPLWGAASPELDIARGQMDLTLNGSPGQGTLNPPVSAFFFDSAWSPPAAAGPVERFGAASLDLTITVATAGKKNAYGATAVPLTLTIATAAKKNAKGATAVPLTFDIAAAGKRTAKGASDVPLSLTTDTAGRKNAKGAASLPIVFDIATAGSSSGGKFGAVDLPVTFGASTTGKRTAKGATDLTLTVAVATAGKKNAKGASDLTLAVSVDTVGRRTARGAVALPLELAISTTGTNDSNVVYTTGFFDQPTLTDNAQASPDGAFFDQPAVRQS